MRSFRGVAAALLKQFLSTGPKTFEQIEQYLDIARLHPTGRHWVDNFLLPTLLVHQFERAEREGDIHLKQLTMERMMKYFFLAGHVQYARYLTQYLLEMRALNAEAKADLSHLVCRHHDGYWNAVSSDQFGEQTAIKIGKGALKGMTLSSELVCEWIDAFPITVHVSDCMDYIYYYTPGQSARKQHKEELRHRRVLDACDRGLIDAEVERYPHPLEDNRPYLYNPISGQIAANDVNVADSIAIGVKMERKYIASLPDGFYNPISSPIKTMSALKKKVKGNKVRPQIDLESIFLRLLMIGQQRKMELEPLFAYELCAVPSSLIDEHGCLRKSNKSALVKRLGVLETLPIAADIVIIDVSQLFYHIVWPHGGSPSDLIASIRGRLSRYPNGTDKVIVFDKYHDVSAKDHERMRRAGEVLIDYELSITTCLPKRDAILKSKNNKRRLASVLCTFNVGDNVMMESQEDGVFGHDEADITMISYVLEAANYGKGVIRVLSDDTDVFVLLVYWVYRADLQCKVQMERWDGTVLDINATCADLGPKCLQLLGMHVLSGCDTTSYPYGKGKITALNTLLAGDFPGLADVLGEVGTTQTDLMEAANPFFSALYRQLPGTSMESARFTLFTKKKKSPKVMALPPTSTNLLQHVLRAHLQCMLWKAADQQAPPDESANITHFGWEIQDTIPVPVIAQGDPAPPELIDVIQCKCKAQGKKCGTEACGCHKEHLSCTSYCNCSGKEDCCNPYSTRKNAQAGVEEDVEMEDAEGEDFEEEIDQETEEYVEMEDAEEEDFEENVTVDQEGEDLDEEWPSSHDVLTVQ